MNTSRLLLRFLLDATKLNKALSMPLGLEVRSKMHDRSGSFVSSYGLDGVACKSISSGHHFSHSTTILILDGLLEK